MPARPSIVLDFIARNASLLQAAAQNERALRGQRRRFRQAGAAVGRATALYGAFTVAAGAAAAAAQSFGRERLAAAQELATFARATGVSVEQLQLFEAAGARVGLVFDDVADVIQTFSESVGLARRGLLAGTGGAQLDALRILGFDPAQILDAERDIGRVFEEFFARLRRRSQAEQQEILGEFSLPDAARRLLALPATPGIAGQQAGVAALSDAEIARLNALFGRMSLTVLRVQRAFSRLLAANPQALEEFLSAIERNTPLILRATGTLAQAVGSGASAVLRAFQFFEEQFGSGRDPQTGERRLTQSDVDNLLIGGVSLAIFRRQIVTGIRALARFIVRGLVSLGPLILRGLAVAVPGATAALAGLPIAAAVALVGLLTAALDEVVTGGRARRYLSGQIQNLFDFIGEQIGLTQAEFEAQGPPTSAQVFRPQGPPTPDATQAQISVLSQVLTERLQQVEDEVNRLIQDRRAETAQGTQAQTIQTLERLRALLQLQATTRQQQRALTQLGDPEFIAEANTQSLIALRAQIAELDQQIAFAASPEARLLRQQLADRQRALEGIEELPFDPAIFLEDRRDALVRQVEEGEALAQLSQDPAARAARQRLAALDLAGIGRETAEQIEQFRRFAQQRQENDALQVRLGILETREARRRVGQLAGLNVQAARAQQALRNAQLEQELAQFTGQGATLLRRQEQALRLRLRNAQLAEELAQASGQSTTLLRGQEESLRLRLRNIQQELELAQASGQSTTLLRGQEESLRLRLRNIQQEQELAQASGQFRRQEQALRLRLRNAQLAEELANFEANAPERRQERQIQARLQQLQQAEQAQFALNNLETNYFDIARSGLADLITGASSLRDLARQILDQILRRTTERFVDAAFAQGFVGGGGGGGASLAGGGIPGGGNFITPGGGGTGFVAGKPTVQVIVDARGADAQGINQAVDRAVPRIADAVAEVNLDRLSGSSVERFRFRQASEED